MERRQAFVTGMLMVTLITGATAIGQFLSIKWDSDAPLSVVVVASGVISFIVLLTLTQTDKDRWEISESSMRTAIAGTIVIVYLVLVGIVAFFKVGPASLPPISQTLVTNFTTIVGVVIAFYFGASAYVQARAKDTPPEARPKQ